MSTYGKDCTPVKNGFAGLINTEHLGNSPSVQLFCIFILLRCMPKLVTIQVVVHTSMDLLDD